MLPLTVAGGEGKKGLGMLWKVRYVAGSALSC